MLILDIGSGSVGAGLAHFSNPQPPMLLYTTRHTIPFQEVATAPRLLSLMFRTLSQTLLDVVSEGMPVAGFSSKRHPLREVFVILASPWIVSTTSRLHLTSEKATLVTEKIFQTLLRDHEKENPPPKRALCVEQKLLRVTLNGYESTAPFQKSANEVMFSLLRSFAQENIVLKMREMVNHIIGVSAVSFHSSSLMTLSAIRDLSSEQQDFILLDARGELTDIAVVKRGMIVDTLSFPFGSNTVIRELQKKTTATNAGILGILKLRAEKKTVGKLQSRIDHEVLTLKEKWLQECKKVVMSFSDDLFLPKTLFLLSEDETHSFFSEAIQAVDWSASLLTSKPFQIKSLRVETASPFIRWSPHVRHDSILALQTITGNRLLTV